MWIPWQDLVNAGLRNLGGDREIIAGVEHVSLRSLAPDITFERDDAALILRLQTPAAALETGVVNFNPSNAPSGILYSQPLSAYLNYGVNYSQLKQGAFSSPAVSKPTASLWGGLQHPQSTVTSALNNRFWCPQYNYNLKQLKLLKELSSPH
ncbi:hypothetical protein [Parathermosynechococcus lividus]|uniref:hypothetical protein n=1 Tax=Parathermosynechococcus lividus TaxID=33070 RepID=UPI0012FDB5C6|nr:hypothetical protein [Thermostichus lividus]